MTITKLLNFSTHAGEPELFEDNWLKITDFVNTQGFAGLELLPVGDYPFTRIPAPLVHGLHLRFFVFLEYIWRNDQKKLLDFFGTMADVKRFYGGTDRQYIIDAYARQLQLAHDLGCEYVVFHPVQCDLAHIYNWQFPWNWQDTLDICSEILNAALENSPYSGLLLFENLWWPGSFRLDSAREYEYLRQKVNYDHCGIVLDTGHLLSSCGGFEMEKDAINYLVKRLRQMGGLTKEIKTVHLTCSLSGNYIKTSQKTAKPPKESTFWQQLAAARSHVSKIDPHEPFTSPEIGRIFDIIAPEWLVFEFTFRDIETWQRKISSQKMALHDKLWTNRSFTQ